MQTETCSESCVYTSATDRPLGGIQLLIQIHKFMWIGASKYIYNKDSLQSKKI